MFSKAHSHYHQDCAQGAQWRVMCLGRDVQCCRCQWATWRESAGKQSQWLLGEPLDGVCDAVSRSRILIHWICSKPWLLFCQPLFLHPHPNPLFVQLMTPYSGWEEEESGLFGRVLHCWGSQEIIHRLSLFPTGEIMGGHRLSWYGSVPPWEGEWCR